MKNWAGNVTYSAGRLHRPSTVAELQHLVASSGRIRALGTGHSFNRVADSLGDLVSLAALPPTVDIDATRSTVTVAAGVRYGELAKHLYAAGFALRTMASLPHISVAGACATGTHGSGARTANLAAAVVALDMVTADGERISLSRAADGDTFCGSVVALGTLGIVTALTLEIVPSYDVQQYVYDGLPRQRLYENFAEIVESGYSVSVFTDWAAAASGQIWLKRLVGEPPPHQPSSHWMGATLAGAARHPVPGMPVANCTQQQGVPGPWHERLPHFRLDYTPSSGDELQAEYIVSRDHAVDALAAVEAVGGYLNPVLQISEIRTIAADDLWLSPSYQRDSVAIHFTWISDTAAVTPVLSALESRLSPYQARPHWGKLFTTSPHVVSALYERWSDFVGLRHHFDPNSKFGNEFADTYFGSADTTPGAHDCPLGL